MKSNYNIIQILGKVYGHTLQAVPFSGILGIANYLAQGLFPAVIVLIQARLFDEAYLLAEGNGAWENAVFYGILFVGTYAVVYLLEFIASITINAGIYERCTSYYSMKLSEKTASLPLIAFESADILNLQNRAKDCVEREILSQIYMSTTVFITSGISVAATISAVAAYSMWFVPISLFSVLPYFIARMIRGKQFYSLKKAQSKKVRRQEYLWSLFHRKQAVKEMRVMGFGDYLAQKWTDVRDDVSKELWQQTMKDGSSLFFCDLLKNFGYGMSIVLALFLVIKGDISIGVFGACIAAFQAMQEAAKAFLIDLGNIPEKAAFANDYFAFLDLPEEQNGSVPICGIKNAVTLSDVSFSYPNSDTCALKHVSLAIRKGEKVVVLGENGSGKTTLSKIILGLYSPSGGDVYYDSVPVSQMDRRTLFFCVSVIAQNFVPYHLTLRENVAISDLDHIKEDGRIRKTLEAVNLDIPGGLDGQIGREFSGIELSGGQWQKLAIARGLFKPSEFILLDEPTSALDPLIESELLQQFMAIAKEKTAVIISHRVGLCRLADKIIVMKDGEICEIGKHHELMEKNGEYKRLYTAQEQWYQ